MILTLVIKKYCRMAMIIPSLLISCGGDDREPGPGVIELSGTVTTLAGGVVGFENATGSQAKFESPYGLVSDAAGNLFVTDFDNNAIRKITPAGVVTTFAGGTEGDENGTGTAAQFRGPVDIDIDAAGNFYVVEYTGNRVRKITSAGVVSSFVGATDGVSGSDNKTGDEARFQKPLGIAIAPNGNMFVTDDDHDIRKITSAGAVTLFAGGNDGFVDGTGSEASFGRVFGIDADASGNLYVADENNHAIRKITSTAVVTTLAGGTSGYLDGDGTNTKFNYPLDVTVDNGIIYVADNSNNRIRKITAAGKVTTLAGSGEGGAVDGKGVAAKFNQPGGIHMDASSANLFVADSQNNSIRKIN